MPTPEELKEAREQMELFAAIDNLDIAVLHAPATVTLSVAEIGMVLAMMQNDLPRTNPDAKPMLVDIMGRLHAAQQAAYDGVTKDQT